MYDNLESYLILTKHCSLFSLETSTKFLNDFFRETFVSSLFTPSMIVRKLLNFFCETCRRHSCHFNLSKIEVFWNVLFKICVYKIREINYAICSTYIFELEIWINQKFHFTQNPFSQTNHIWGKLTKIHEFIHERFPFEFRCKLIHMSN